MITIYSENNIGAFITTAESIGLEINASDNPTAFAKLLASSHEHIIVHVATESGVHNLDAMLTQINALIATGRVKSFKIIIAPEFAEFVSKFESHPNTSQYCLPEILTLEIIKEALSLSITTENVYGAGKTTRTPMLDGDYKTIHSKIMNDFLKDLTATTLTLATPEELQASIDLMNADRRARTDELNAKLPDSMDADFYLRAEKEEALINAAFDIAIAKQATAAVPQILADTTNAAKVSMNELTIKISNIQRMKAIAGDEENIRSKLSEVRRDAKAVYEANDSIREALLNLKSNLTLPLPDNEMLVELLSANKDLIESDVATNMFETAITVSADQKKILPMFVDSVKSIATMQTNLQAAFNNVIQGYESVIHDSFSLIDKLKSTASIDIIVDGKLEANVMQVYGTAQSGATNFATCSAYAQSMQGGKACILDLKTGNPQLQYYVRNGIELYDLIKMSLNASKELLLNHLAKSPFLAITNKQSGIMGAEFSERDIQEFITTLLSILTEADTTVYVVNNRKDCYLKKHIETLTVMVTIITDTNIGKLAEFSNLVRGAAMNKRLRFKSIAITKIEEVNAELLLEQAGIPSNKFVLKAVPNLPIDLYKMQGAIYSASSTWRW